MSYFEKIWKHYSILALEKSGIKIDSDTHSELEEAARDLEERSYRLGFRLNSAESRIDSLEETLSNLEIRLSLLENPEGLEAESHE